jgi:membrane protease YdiL (CAAX protease family)
MLANSSNSKPLPVRTVVRRLSHNRWVIVAALPLWVFTGFFLAQVVFMGLLYVAQYVGISFVGMNSTVLNAFLAAVIYLLTLSIVIGLPWAIRRHWATTKEDVGLTRLLSWKDLGLAPVGFLIYFFGSAVLVYVAGLVIPWFNADQTQQTGFSHLTQYYEYLLAFVTLIVVAPVAEEILFRGFLYGKLRKYMPVWGAILITSALFGFIHGQWNVGVDVFALSIVLCVLREITGSIWAGILLHMIKNGIAFYILFINPLL